MSASQILPNATINAAVVTKKTTDATMKIKSFIRVTKVIKV
jgi:hypothetical protein